MRLGLIGGTGKEGTGLALRWALAGHEVSIGSRTSDKGVEKAAALSQECGKTITGGDNAEAVEGAEVVILCVPYSAHAATLEAHKAGLQGKILIDITVPLRPPKVRKVHLPPGGAAALENKAIVGEGVTVIAALHHVSSMHLRQPEHQIDCDVLVCGEGPENRNMAVGLIEDLGLSALDAGPLANAIALEAMTPVLLYMNKRYKAKGAGLRITGFDRG